MLKYTCVSLPYLAVLALGASTGTPAWGLDPGLPPSGNFDLNAWKITLPDQTEIKEQELSSGFESTDEFYTDPVTGGMVFKCPNNGATGGSSYPRSELREMLRAGTTSISTSGIGLNNWVFSSSSPANQQAAGGVDGALTATLTVDHVSTAGDSSMVGRVIVGQIHASSDEPCRLYYRKLPGNTKGSIYIAHEPTTGSEQWYDMIGSRSSSAADPVDGIALGEEWGYEIEVVGDDLTVTIMRAGKPDVVTNVNMSASGFADDWMYFKAGCYNQNNSGDAGQYAQVTFYALTHTHDMFGNDPPACSMTSPADGATFNEGDDIIITADASDSDGTVTKVEFYEGANLLGEDTSAPYSYTWTGAFDGSYSLTARATDNGGGTTTSTAVGVTVIPGPNDPPTCSITSPTNGASFTAGNDVTIHADATDGDGTVAMVEFYQGASLLGQDTSAPFSYTWNNVGAGGYSLTAKATDDNAAATTSTAVTISVAPSADLSSADFESGFGEWVNVGGDTDEWRRDSGGTSSSNTGPSSGANGSTWYVYLECSSGYAEDEGDHAFLEGPELVGSGRTLSFYYHMYGNQMGTLSVDVYSGGSWTEGVWSVSGQQHGSSGEAYSQAVVDLSAYSGAIRIRFRGVATGGVRGDMALDDIEVTAAIDTYTLTPSAGANGFILPAVPVVVDHGGSTGFVITASADYHIEDVLVDQVSVGWITQYTFSNVTSDHSIAASFAVDPSLAISLAGTDIVLSWPTNGSSGFDLETATTGITVPTWSTGGTPTLVGGFNYVTNPVTGSDAYYRLHRP